MYLQLHKLGLSSDITDWAYVISFSVIAMIDVRIAKNGTGFQPWPNLCSIFLGLCPRLVLASPSALRKILDSLLGPKAGSISAWGEAPCTGTKDFNRAVSLGYPSADRGSPNKYSMSGNIKTSPISSHK
jgi:hypothetical protein